MAAALHGSAELRTLFAPQRMVEFGQERRNRVAYQMPVARGDQFRRRTVRHFDKPRSSMAVR